MVGSRAAAATSAIFGKPAVTTGDPSRTSARALLAATDLTVCSRVPARASRICTLIPNVLAACSAADTCDFPVRGSQSTVIARRSGCVVLSSSRSLPTISGISRNMPVMLPPGLASVATNPAAMGSVS